MTLNHLDSLKQLVISGGNTDNLSELLEECIRQIQTAYSGLGLSELAAMRQSLCTFFQDRKVKVSLFLHDGAQAPDGSFVVPATGKLQPGAFCPGTVRYFAGGAEVRQDVLPCVNSGLWQPADALRTQLGTNMYDRERNQASAAAASVPAAPTPGAAAASAASEASTLQPVQRVAPSPAPAAPSVGEEAHRVAAVGELNYLASLIGAQPAAPSDTFKLESLFGADIFAKDTSTGQTVQVIQIDGTAPSEHRTGLDSIRQQMEIGPPEGDAAPDDLLDLMDSA